MMPGGLSCHASCPLTSPSPPPHPTHPQPGDDLLVVEAMKMRNAVKADREGVVEGVLATQGQAVAADAPLVRFAAPATAVAAAAG